MEPKKNLIILMAMPDCNDNSSNLQIATNHKITTAEHDAMVSSFFGDENPGPLDLFMNDPRINLALDCQYYGIKMAFDPTDTTGNQDIKISMDRLSSLSAPHSDYFVMFSIHLFKGLKIGKAVTKLELRKGYRDEGGLNVATIALRGFNNLGVVVYNGDLTNMYPLHKSDN